MNAKSPIYSDNYLRRNRLTGSIRRIRRILREIEEVLRLIPEIPEDEPRDGTRKTMARHYLTVAHVNATAAHNQLVIQRDGIKAIKKMQDK